MLYGYDFSHWNADAQIERRLPGASFVCHKLTEGENYADPKAVSRSKLFTGKVTFWYHLIRPDRGNARDEALHYIAWLDRLGSDNAGLALDLEQTYVPYAGTQHDLDYILEFIRTVRTVYDKSFLMYMGDLYPEKWYKALQENNCFLWIARWGREPVHNWTVWQYTDKVDGENLDGDKCRVSIDELKALCTDKNLPFSMTPEEVAQLTLQVIQGKFGSGQERKEKLGKKYNYVQKTVDFIYKEVLHR